MSVRKYLVSIVGPTAVGKTALSIYLAEKLQAEVISADSRQFYKEMEIGTAKPTKEELKVVKHHFINTLSIDETYSAGKFEVDALRLLDNLFQKYQVVIMVGGSGLYCKGVWEGFDEMPVIEHGIRDNLNRQYQEEGLSGLLEELKSKDPDYYRKVDLHNHQRVIRALEVIRSTNQTFSQWRRKGSSNQNPRNFDIIKIGMEDVREKIYRRIDERMDQMIENGLFDEARSLEKFKHFNALQTVGYSEIFPYLAGEYDFEEAVRLLKRNSRRYAKRQLTWFKRDPEIKWFSPDEAGSVYKYIQSILDAKDVD